MSKKVVSKTKKVAVAAKKAPAKKAPVKKVAPKKVVAKKAPAKKAPAKKVVAKKVVAKKPAAKKPVKKAVKKPVAKPVATKPKAIKKPAPKRKKVLATPKGYNSITPFLVVNNAAKAADFYKRVFLAKEGLRMDAPEGKISHMELKIGDAKIMLADEFPERGAKGPESFGGCAVSIHVYTKDVDATVKSAVSAGAKLVKPVETMFYGDRTGAVQDPFGHTWHVATHVEDVSPAMQKKRAAEMYAKK